MVRPRRRRRIRGRYDVTFFKPAGIPKHELDEVSITIDEIEAMRLADYNGLYQADAAEKMGVSRQTFGNILKSAHKKITDALIHGKSIRLEGGIIEFEKVFFKCRVCGNEFTSNSGESVKLCPECTPIKGDKK